MLTLPKMLPKPLEPTLTYVGFYSYSIYLWHLPWLAVVQTTLGGRAPNVAAFYVGSIAASVLIAKLVELPTLRLRERWIPQPTRDSPAVKNCLERATLRAAAIRHPRVTPSRTF
jgi:peptidoglycan/LPS O-acetylase OafA/YrhL